MPAIINSAPGCVGHDQNYNSDDAADFAVGNNYIKTCEGFMTFGPGSTYGDGGQPATTQYMALTWIGIAFMVFAIIAWMAYENKRLVNYARDRKAG